MEAPENIGSALKSIISRYGEMTSDPTKLVDSEGEEMNLNKVDKALKSVGITLQDANGQFRNFDEVILELSSKWDQIDTNTQRYIATVMAGNRQQSRFLAMVGNYERLAELSEEAANSEDAALIQTLKTMDNISTKLTQLKVTFQEFYTSTGVEELIKGILDFITQVIENLNGIPKVFNKIPVAALAMSSGLIAIIKTLGINIVTEISLALEKAKTEAQRLAGEGGKSAGQNFVQQFKDEINQIKTHEKGFWKQLGDNNTKISQSFQAISAALTATSFLMDQNTLAGKRWAGVMQVVSGAMQGVKAISEAIAKGNWIGAALSAFVTILSGIDTYIEDTQEKIERLTTEAEELKNESLQVKNNYKTLNSAIKKYEQLKETRYESAEATEEYEGAVKNLTEAYPELIRGFTASGEAIIDASAQERLLTELRKDSAEATYLAAQKEAELQRTKLKAAEDAVEGQRSVVSSNLTQQGFTENFTSFQSAGESIASDMIEVDANTANKETVPFNSKIYKYLQTLQKNGAILSYKNDGTTRESGNYDRQILNKEEILLDYGALMDAVDRFGEEGFDFYQAIRDAIPDDTLFSLAKEMLMQDTEMAKYLSLQADYYAQEGVAHSARKLEASTYFQQLFQDSDIVGDDSLLFNIFSDSIIEEFLDTDLSFADFAIGRTLGWEEVYTAFEDFYNSLSTSRQELLETMLQDSDTYSSQAIIDKFNLSGTTIAEKIESYYLSIYEENENRLKNLFEGIKYTGEGWDQIKKLDISKLTKRQADAISTIVVNAERMADRGFKSLANNYLGTFNQLWLKIENLDIDEAQRDSLYSSLSKADLSSVEGIKDFIETLENYSFLEETDINSLTELLTDLSKNFLTNITVSIQTLQEKYDLIYKELNKEIEDIGREVDLSAAIELYNKMSSILGLKDMPSFSQVFTISLEDPSKYILSNTDLFNEYLIAQIAAIEKENELLESKIETLDYGTTETGEDFFISESFTEDLLTNIETLQGKPDLENIDETALREVLSEETLTILDEYGLWDIILEYYQENITWEKVQQIIEEKRDLLAKELASSEAYKEQLKNFAPIQALVNSGFFSQAKETNPSYLKYIQNAEREAYDALIQDFLENGSNLYGNYVGDLVEKASQIQRGEGSEGLIKELAFLAGYTLEETNNAIIQFYQEQTKKTEIGAREALEQVSFSNLNELYGSLESIGALFSTLGLELNTSLLRYDETLGIYIYDFSTDEKLQQALENIKGKEEIIADSIADYLNNIISILSNGVSGSMTNIEFAQLQDYIYGLDPNLALQFTETTEGLKLTQNSVLQIYSVLKDTNSLAAQVVLDELTKNAMEAEEKFNNMYEILEHIAKINEELARIEISDIRREELERELILAENIRDTLMEAGNAFNFMNQDLPTDYTNPLSAWEGMGDAWKVLDGDDFKAGYIDYTDLYNMINMMESAGVDLEKAGFNFNGQALTTSELMRAAGQALVNVDGETFVDLSKLGTQFQFGAEDMKEGLMAGIKIIANSQIELLNAEIAMLETVVKTEEAFESIDTDENKGILSTDELINGLFGDIDAFNNGELKEESKIYEWLLERKDWAVQVGEETWTIFKILEALGDSSAEDRGTLLKHLVSFINEEYSKVENTDWSVKGGKLFKNGLEVDLPSITFSSSKSILDYSLLENGKIKVSNKGREDEELSVEVDSISVSGNEVFYSVDGQEMTAEQVVAKLGLDISTEEGQKALTDLQNSTETLKNSVGPLKTSSQRAEEEIQGLDGSLASVVTQAGKASQALSELATTLTGLGGVSAAGGSSQAKGSLGNAKATGTLMGELGPELYVTGGRYYIAGQNGAEFVNLPSDAIVFNHLQTRRLLGNGSINGTGRPVTNERNAVAMATGTTGPAKASAADALKELYEIRAMWQGLLNASAQDFSKKAGSGGSSGSGSGDDNKAFMHELERWYNLLRQIAKLEQQITYEQAKRENMQSGYKHVQSLEKELALLKKQQAAHQELSDLQREYYDERRAVLEKTSYGELIFTYDEDGLMQYIEEDGKGLDILAELERTDENGKAVRTAKQQVDFLKEVGFDISTLLTNADGSKVKSNDYQTMMQIFWDGVDGWMAELDELYDSYNESMTSVEESIQAQNEILQEYIDNQLSVEERLMEAIVSREEAEIERLEKELDALEDATDAYLDGLKDSLDREKEMYEKNKDSEETSKLQRQLAILKRTGGSASEIQSLQDEISSRLEDSYFQQQEDQIDAIQQAADNQIEKLQTQIDIMNETLEYQKANGLLWEEVYEMMNNWSPEQMLQFIEEFLPSYRENSALQNEEDSKEALKEFEIWVGKRENAEAIAKSWQSYYDSVDQYSDEFKAEHEAGAKEAYSIAYATKGEEEAKKAADAYFAAQVETEEQKEDEEKKEPEDSSPSTVGNGSSSNSGSQSNSSQSNKNLSLGSRGEEVKKLQGKLKGLGYSLKQDGIFGAETQKAVELFQAAAKIKIDGIAGQATLAALEKALQGRRYKQGGLVDFTGPAWVDGTKSKPEAFLSAEDTAMLKSKIFDNNKFSLRSVVELFEGISNGNKNITTNNDQGVVFENVQITIESGTIANDYDARRAGEMALEEMLKISRKTTNRIVSRR